MSTHPSQAERGLVLDLSTVVDEGGRHLTHSLGWKGGRHSTPLPWLVTYWKWGQL